MMVTGSSGIEMGTGLEELVAFRPFWRAFGFFFLALLLFPMTLLRTVQSVSVSRWWPNRKTTGFLISDAPDYAAELCKLRMELLRRLSCNWGSSLCDTVP